MAHIIDQFRGDKEELKRCAVVSKTWLRYSRVHLFRTVKVSSEDGPERYTAFFLFLQSHPSINAVIRHLKLAGKEQSWMTQDDDDELPVLNYSSLTAILGQLSSLQSVSFSDIQLLPSDDDHSESVPSTLLRRATFSYVASSMPCFIKVLSLFNLTELEIISNPFENPSSFQGRLPSMALATLKVEEVSAQFIRLAVEPLLAPNYLRSLQADINEWDCFEALRGLLVKSRARLQSLDLRISRSVANISETGILMFSLSYKLNITPLQVTCTCGQRWAFPVA